MLTTLLFGLMADHTPAHTAEQAEAAAHTHETHKKKHHTHKAHGHKTTNTETHRLNDLGLKNLGMPCEEGKAIFLYIFSFIIAKG